MVFNLTRILCRISLFLDEILVPTELLSAARGPARALTAAGREDETPARHQ